MPLSRLILLLALAACSDSPSISAPVINAAYSALDGAYASDVKPADAKYTQCRYALIGARHVARCGVSFGGNGLAMVGYWEIEPQGDGFAVYAMNGKALAALDKMVRPGALTNAAHPGVFKPGQGRPPLDMPAVQGAFH